MIELLKIMLLRWKTTNRDRNHSRIKKLYSIY